MTTTSATLLSLADRVEGFIIKTFRVSVDGFGNGRYYTTSRGKALAEAWRSAAFNGMTFGQFLKIARAHSEEPSPRFGEQITVSGRPAYLVSWDKQYIQFVYHGSGVVMNSHPLDVLPLEARRGTPYYEPAAGSRAMEADNA